MKHIITAFVLLSFTACKTAKWPAEAFIKKNNYEEVIGHFDEPQKARAANDKFAMYPNGLKGINALITGNITYPSESRQNNIEGKVIIKYIVETDGFIKTIEVVKSVDPALDQEAIRIIKLMRRWIPGTLDGKPCRVEYNQPFNFKIR